VVQVSEEQPAVVSRRRAQTRDRLLVAATHVFAERGVIGASVEEICEAAGFTRGAFYSNFADKDALVLALIEQSIASQYAAAETSIAAMKAAPGDFTPQTLVSMALTEFETVGRPGGEAVLVQQELLLYAARKPSLREPYLAFVDECQRQLRTLLEDALQFARLEFSCDFGDALEMLAAVHSHMHLQSLFTGAVDSRMLQTLLLAITRPSA
jgi:AcrR family transcriptional regulator